MDLTICWPRGAYVKMGIIMIMKFNDDIVQMTCFERLPGKQAIVSSCIASRIRPDHSGRCSGSHQGWMTWLDDPTSNWFRKSDNCTRTAVRAHIYLLSSCFKFELLHGLVIFYIFYRLQVLIKMFLILSLLVLSSPCCGWAHHCLLAGSSDRQSDWQLPLHINYRKVFVKSRGRAVLSQYAWGDLSLSVWQSYSLIVHKVLHTHFVTYQICNKSWYMSVFKILFNQVKTYWDQNLICKSKLAKRSATHILGMNELKKILNSLPYTYSVIAFKYF